MYGCLTADFWHHPDKLVRRAGITGCTVPGPRSPAGTNYNTSDDAGF